MINKILITFLLVILVDHTLTGQVENLEDAKKTMSWIIENPQLGNDSLFVNKTASIIRWQFSKNPNSVIKTTGLNEFFNKTSESYKLRKNISLVYTCSTFLSGTSDDKETALYAMKNALVYYENSLKLDPSLSNNTLEKYLSLDEEGLKKRVYKQVK